MLVERRGLPALLFRVAATGAHRLLRLRWWVTRPRTRGVSALPVTPEGKVILVRHSYVRGWYIPGGGRNANEAPRDAALRELREEIGMTSHGRVHAVGEIEHRPHHKRDTMAFFVVEDVVCAARLSIEIEAIGVFSSDALPDGVSPRSAACIARWRESSSTAPDM